MKTLLAITLLSVLAGPATADTDRARMLDAIAPVESANRHWVIGPLGEVTAYQMLPRNWRRLTTEPLSRARRDPAFGRLVAFMHLDQLVTELRAYGLQETPYNLALAWRAGSPAAAHGTATAAQRDHAQRIANLYDNSTK